VVLNGDASAKRTGRSRTLHGGISLLAIGAGLAMPQPLLADTTITGTTVGPQVISSSIGQFSITGTGTVTTTLTAAVLNDSTIGTLTNQGQIINTSPLFYGLLNHDSIGSIVNSGTISGLGVGILLSRSTVNSPTIPVIGAITNSGLILGATTGAFLNVGGTVGTLTNSGTITGPIAISNTSDGTTAGVIGTIVNTGLIAGNIVNDSGSMTIRGGSGATIGTITGSIPGSVGTITTGGDIVFASGNLLLNDGIVASGRTVTNSGASLTLSTLIGVAGTYAQSAGKLVIGTAGALSVSGVASLTGGTVQAVLSNTGNYLAGTLVTLVQSTDTASYAGVAVGTTGATGLKAAGSISGNQLLLLASNDYVGGTLSTLDNSGTITSTGAAVYVAATGNIGTLVNSGTLFGATRGVYLFSGAHIGTITNSGQIAAGTLGGSAAGGIANSAVIDTIVNDGTILSSKSSAIGNNFSTASIGRLVNNGLLSGATGGIYTEGTIDTLINTGRIIGAQAGINFNGGTIGTIDNSGTIAGPLALSIASGSTISGIGNRGLISGNILNGSANVLTITGGSAGTVGTLTGQSGKGTITNTAGNLVFASGDLLLNDNIVATGRTVSNTGAGLTLGTLINLTGNYSQTSGILRIDPIQAGLIASGAAVVSGGSIITDFASTGNYLQGSYTLLSGSTLNLTGATVLTGAITGLDRSPSTVGNKLLLSITNDYVGGTLATLVNAAALTGSDTGLYVATTGSIGTVTNSGTFGGAQFGVNNRGTIATFSNLGIVTNANFTAFWNQGSIGQLTNSGTITNSSWAILNSATIGTLTNSGIIAGGGNAVQNNGVIVLVDNRGTMSGGNNALAGTFQTIVNSGLIRGNINQSNGSIGTIIGGTGGTIGTLTGFSGSTLGTLGAGADLTFASGALLLNDKIIAVGASPAATTISNTGADIALSTIVTIDANFRQTSGVLGLGAAGRLVVTQAATFSGGTISTDVSGAPANATYQVGDSIGGNLVSGGVGSSYSGVSIVATGGLTGLAATAGTSGTNLVLVAANIYVGDTQATVSNAGTITGVTYPLYVANTGTVGTLTNSGTLNGTADGLNTNGSIGTLLNSGRIFGAQKGLGNQSTIATLVNAIGGTILGGTAAGLQNDTSLGTLTNAGYISSGSAGFANYGTLGGLSNSGTISGGPQAIYNAGNVLGTIANSGTISAPQTGIMLAGTVGGLVNSGYISGNSSAVNVADTLTTLINQAGGTINGVVALQLSGTLGGFSNSGVITGAIRNDSAAPLTISGGAAGTVGTLTGQSGRGTITSTLANMVFASGNLLLNDNIVATGRTVSNSGASIALNTLINLTGNYSQSAGTLTIDPMQGGLIVSGAAVISGGTVSSSLASTGNYLPNSYTLVGASSLNLTGATVSIGTITGLARTVSTIGNKLLLSITNDYVGVTLATLSNSAALTAASTGLYVATTGNIGTMTNTGTFGGAQFGVNNRGTIGTFSNAGLITNANFTALWNQGSIGQLTNSGTITNSSWAILNSGTIGTLTNSGVIAGGGVAVQNNAVITLLDNRGTLSGGTNALSGTYATIANSGIIRGNINPSGGTIGTIIGGTGGTIGTLTGASGTVQGTLGVSTNLTFASGALLLNDKILVVGPSPSALTVSNVGADIALATIVTIGANYHQTAGVLSLGSNGGLVVTQAAVLSGGTISANLGGLSTTSTYRTGSAAGGTLVAGGIGSSYAGVDLDVPGSITGLKLSAMTSGTNLIVAAGNDYIGDTQSTFINSTTIAGATYALYAASTGTVGTLANSGTLSGTATGLYNFGRIEAFANSGRIDGLTALQNAGTMNTIDNSGTILGAGGTTAYGVFNGGTIGLLANNGLISGGTATNASYGIHNAGQIGTLANLANGIVSGVAANGAGISNGGTIGYVSNAGLVTGSGSGVSNTGTIDTFDNSGTIRTTDDQRMTGLFNSGTIGTLTNSGIIGNNVGIFNAGGSIGVLTNASDGTIGGAVGIFNTGSVGIVSNSGTISGTSEGVYVSGTIGTLLNAGLLVGSVGAAITITSSGTLGGIANSGVIRGDIVNASANDLTITGGGATLVGTFTGNNGRGLIQNTASNLFLGSGALLLNNDIVVGPDHTITNAGANVELADVITITGNFGQTGGSLSLIPGTTGLVVSGTAAVSGGTVLANLSSTGNYMAGDSVLLIAGGSGSSYGGVTLDGAPTGLLTAADTVGSALVETFGNTYIGGTLATLSNTGSLNAPTAIYIASTGSVGLLANSGTIQGDILNLSADALTIAGGTNGTVGTFTGQSGQGRIVSTLGNVVLASGNMVLDNAVDVGAGTLVNTGAAVALTDAVSVTGAFAQTGGTLSFADGTGQVIASGAAALAGGTIALTGLSATENYLVGTSKGLVVQGGAGSSYTNLSYASDVTGLQLAGTTQDDGLQVEVANHYVGGSLGSIVNAQTLAVPTSVYINTTGTLGTLTNEGSLTGQIGVVNHGVVAMIANAGTFDLATTAISNTGTIGGISNDGLLAGPVVVDNAGALGTIANNGTLAGNIINRSAQDLVFAGSNAGFGTLTGYISGSQGTITNTLGNVVLASGGIVLNDTVVLGAGTLVNDGATVRLVDSVNVVGNYVQGSGTLGLGMASLLVSGVANISGGLITSNQLDSTANYVAGSGAGTLVRAGVGSSYNGVSVASGVTGLAIAAVTATIGGNVDLLLSIDNDYVGGTLDNLVNSGTITGVATAAYVAASGSLGTLGNSGILEGARFGVRNLGVIERVENDGVIGGTVGLYNGGTIGTIVNSGSIVDTPLIEAAGLSNDGVIDAVLNAGLISGTARGLYNNATIGRIVNSGTIAGLLALYNGGSIGTIDNSGVIIDSAGPVSAGVNNDGQLDVLRNSGTISGETYGLVNTGTIGRLTNEGLITAATAIYAGATGTFGPIENVGVIAGNIENGSAQALTIIGGTFENAGTLTGFGRARGTILSTGADVVFGPGVQLLDDDIVATGHVVSNMGATLGLTTSASITGGYSQTAGALYIVNGAQLDVSGVANLAGGAVVTQFDPTANYLANETAGTLIRGGVGSSYAGAIVDTGDTPGLALSTDVAGTDLIVTARNTYVGDSLGAVSNTGSLAADYPVYVAATGSLGSLTNTGTLSGAIAAIYNAGTLGPIVNSGVVAGNIDNRSAQTLLISGGTLTGYAPGSQGTIFSANGNVELAGDITLNDAFDVGTNTVVNAGAVLSLANSVNVTGNFSQDSGLLALGDTSALVVSGSALFTGGTVSTSIATAATYLAGAAVGTLVQGGTGSRYAGVQVDTGDTPGLALSAGASGSNLVVTAGNNYVGSSLSSLTTGDSLTTDYPVYVSSTGSLGSLTNTGTLSGVISAIYNAGTLGPIVNSGVIAGNIDNRSAQTLQISGGTLTGYAPDSQGTIFSANGNVELAGEIALNDAFDVGTNTVVNAGASLSLANSVNVTGNFSQESGLLALGDTSALVVSGSALFTGGTVSTSVATAATYLAGASVGTLVQGGTGSRYAGVQVDTGDTPGLALSAGASGSNLVVTAGNNYVGSSLAGLTTGEALTADYPVYVSSTGSLGSLTNTGTLSGAIAAVYNAGTLGPIVNSGVIAGNIDNRSAQTLLISGGTGTDVGTLTGFGEGRGTILSTGGHVEFASGTLALNDDIIATGHIVSNSGADLRLGSGTTITGGYSQTSGSLILAQDAKLVVSDAATLSGGTISASFSPVANYLAGATAGTLVQAGTGSSYTGVSVSTGSTPGLALASATVGTNLIVAAENNFVGGSLGSLSNEGTLSASYPVYIAATGTLGSLTNSGTLSGSNAAIRNLGLIGPIANTGVIAGNIVSDARADLSITGGGGTVFGTLTGYATGSQGTISNTGGNLVLGGNILLNDAVDVGSRTVLADGATLAVNAPVGIVGNYSQTGGKLLIGVTSTAAYGQLSVTGSANLTGTNVTLVKLGSAALAAGQAYTVVKAGGALTFSNLTSSITGLNGVFSSVASGGATGLVLTLSDPGGTITPPPPATNFTGTGIAAGGPGVGTGAALDAIADLGGAAAAPVITDVLLPLSQLPLERQVAAIIQLAPTQLTPQVIAVAVSPAVSAIVQHQDVLAAAATGREERGLAAGSQGQRGAVWGQFLINSATRAAVSAASPYEASSYGVMIGADLIGTSNLIAGGAISWVNSTANGRGNISGSATTLNSFQATGYFTWQPGDPETAGLAIDGQLGFGYNQYDQRRRIDFLGVSARASYDGQQYLGGLRASYTIPLSTSASVMPFASIREVHLHNAGYQERDAGSANLQVSKLDVDSLSHEIGFQGAGIFEGKSGRFAPVLKLGWVHTYTNGPIPLTAVLGGVAFTSTSARGARDGLTVGTGLSFMQTERFRIGVQYDGDLRRDFKSHSGTVKMTFNL